MAPWPAALGRRLSPTLWFVLDLLKQPQPRRRPAHPTHIPSHWHRHSLPQHSPDDHCYFLYIPLNPFSVAAAPHSVLYLSHGIHINMQTISGVGIGFNRPKRTFSRTKGQARLMFKCMRVAITPDPACCVQAAAYLDAATTPLPHICTSLGPSKKKTHSLPAAGRGALGMQCLQAIVDELYARQSDSDDSDDSAWPLPAPEGLDTPAPRTPLATMLEDCLLGEHTARVDMHAHATEWPLDTTEYVPPPPPVPLI